VRKKTVTTQNANENKKQNNTGNICGNIFLLFSQRLYATNVGNANMPGKIKNIIVIKCIRPHPVHPKSREKDTTVIANITSDVNSVFIAYSF